MKQIIELIDISLTGKSGNKIFDGLNFSLPSGGIALIGGPPDIKKIALIELIIGSYPPDSGVVLFFEKKLDAKKGRLVSRTRKQIGGVGGVFDLVSYQTVNENISYPLILNSVPRSVRKKKVFHTLTEYGLSSKKQEKAGNLSREERVLALLARATIADQPLLLIDEPLAGLDAGMISKVTGILNNLSVAGHSMIILTTDSPAIKLPNACEYSFENGSLK
jgi:ABC-type multidrug transport system ATPase subunit